MPPRPIRINSGPAKYFGWGGWRGSEKSDVSNTVVRLEYVGRPPSMVEWSDTNFLLAEVLRDKYDPRNIVRLEFRAIPDTEDEYEVEVDALAKSPVRLFSVRTPHKKAPAHRKKESISKRRSVEPISFTVDLSGRDLSEGDRELLIAFNRLPLERRIRFWQKYVAPLCK